MRDSWPSGRCVKCNWVFWSAIDRCYTLPQSCPHEWELFTDASGQPIGCFSVKGFNARAYWRGEKVTVKQIKKLDHPVFGWRGEL